MKPVDFDYIRPADVGAVCHALAEAKGEGKIIAGGQTLVPLLAMRLARPALVIDINRIADLAGIEKGGDHVTIRACTRQAAALRHETIRRRLPLLAKALGFVGHEQTRNRGTIGGSLANADPAAEIALAAVTLEASIAARSLAGTREIAADDFFLGPMTTALAAAECLTAVRVPIWAGRVGTGFHELSIRRSDFALVAAAAQVALDGDGVCRRAAIGIGGAAAIPLRLDDVAARLVGTRLGERDIAAAADAAQRLIEPMSDIHASAAYRRRVAGALIARALAEARDEALAA